MRGLSASRLVVSLLIAFLVLDAPALLGCGGSARGPSQAISPPPPPPKPPATAGAPCVGEGSVVCTGAASALVCSHGVHVAIRCQGPGGCAGDLEAGTCHDGIRAEGDPCREPQGEDDTACTADGTKELVCRDGKSVLRRTCRGAKACRVEGTSVLCDDSVAEVDDACLYDFTDANYACSVDGATELRCDAHTRRVGVHASCRGPKRCKVIKDSIDCDETVGRPGEPCDPIGNLTCSEDAKAQLECAATGTWAKTQDCRKGCSIADHKLDCR